MSPIMRLLAFGTTSHLLHRRGPISVNQCRLGRQQGSSILVLGFFYTDASFTSIKNKRTFKKIQHHYKLGGRGVKLE
jgi:hypothetical protein